MEQFSLTANFMSMKKTNYTVCIMNVLLAGSIVLIYYLVTKYHLQKSGSYEMKNDPTSAQIEINVEVRLLL